MARYGFVLSMGTYMCKNTVVCDHWMNIGRFYYYSMIGMPCRSIYSISTTLNFTSSINVHLRMVKQDLKNKICSSKEDFRLHKHGVTCFHMGSDCNGRNATHSRAHQTSGLCRWYSDDRGPPRRKLPSLMDFPEIVWPSVIKTLRNWILANLIIKPYFDQEFGLPDFIYGSKQAVEYVSGCLSRGDFAALENMVTQDALQEVKRNLSTFSMLQRQELALLKDDIYFSFPYQIGVMFSDDDKNQQRFVEITMCYHVLQGLKDLTQQGITPPLNMGMLPEYRDKIFICNYRFIREFTKGVEDQWTVNVINHFKPSDYVS
ncbi:hypothetical protein ANN_23103 [Periplaneta americana]|uniref:Juvenile hormone esterase binding protein n=1 Tax=Periplaneta americana TaxID=6978 RepID=A0ABQ8SLF3_PERAM|nr:hypothetical protein ANN_23103 [Periplaneta americana]